MSAMLKLAIENYRAARTPLARLGAYLGLVAAVDAIRAGVRR
jgi:hypothetical protein